MNKLNASKQVQIISALVEGNSLRAAARQTLRVTPAMEAGVSDHVWSIEKIVDLLDRSANIAA